MSNLTEALNIILNWLQQNQWCRFKEAEKSASLLQPGLSRAEIDSFIGDSNLQLPQEIYELYQWRNGGMVNEWDYVGLFDIYHNSDGFYPWGFIPFQGVVNKYISKSSWYANMEPEIFKRISAFPCISDFQNPAALEMFLGHESCLTGYVYKDENYKYYPVVFRDFKGGGNTVLRLYSSLTNMMMTLAESYEIAYYIGENGYLKKDKNKVLEVWRKYNSEQLVTDVLTKLEQLEPLLPQLEMGFDLIKEVGDTLSFTHDKRLIAPLIRVLKRPPTNTQFDKNLDYFRQMSSLYLGSLGGADVVDSLIDALRDEYWLTRYWATITLGEITDLRAVSPLNKILIQDSHEMVRQAANEALAKITNPDSVTEPIYSNPAIVNLSASAALYGMTLSDMLTPNIETLRENLNNYSRIGEDEDLSSGDDSSDNVPF